MVTGKWLSGTVVRMGVRLLPTSAGIKSQVAAMSFLGLEGGSHYPDYKTVVPVLGGIKGNCMGRVTSRPGHQGKDELTRHRIQKDISDRGRGRLKLHYNVLILTRVLVLPCECPFFPNFLSVYVFFSLVFCPAARSLLPIASGQIAPRLRPQRS